LIRAAVLAGITDRAALPDRGARLAELRTDIGRGPRAKTHPCVVEAALKIRDEDREYALTLRALPAPGSGASLWHVTDKNDLPAAPSNHVMAFGPEHRTCTSVS
jgi:hypothetical protein